MVALLNDWEVVQWLAIPPFHRRADARFYVDHVRANHEAGPATEFAIALAEGDGVVGSIGLRPKSTAECGNRVLAWSAALGPWLRFGSGRGGGGLWFRQLSFSGLRLETDPENERSARVLEEIGFPSDRPSLLAKRGPVACQPGAALSW